MYSILLFSTLCEDNSFLLFAGSFALWNISSKNIVINFGLSINSIDNFFFK